MRFGALAPTNVMVPLRRILVPTDYSFCAVRACGAAIDLASRSGAEIRYIHVHEPGQPADTGEAADDWRVPIQYLTGPDPAPAILEAAEAFDADLIVMGTHGRRGFRRLVMGSVTESVMRKSGRPVLAVPCVPVEGRRVLVPVDLTSESRMALDYGRAFAAMWDAPLDALRVVDVGSLHLPYGVASSAETRDAALHEAANTLERFCARDGVRAPLTHVVVGTPAEAAIDFAHETGARLIVVTLPHGSHGHSDAVGIRTIRLARCAVLGIPVGTERPHRDASSATARLHADVAAAEIT